MTEHKVCRQEEIPEGGARIVALGDLEIGVIRHGGDLFAYRNLCPHQGGPACEGVRMASVVDTLDGDGTYLGQNFDEGEMHIVCPWHGYEYRLSDGVNVCDAKLKLKKYEVAERDGHVWLSI
ncbi:Rieske 2Fe-2S domain-containing protein [Rhodobacterales bacterium HKCCE2091]|nr:Rieske 2Fe-2S domain-containing protein [Rhodobacterales bacterium HKCCE2091]